MHRRAAIGWQNLKPLEAVSVDMLLRTLREGRGVVKVYAGGKTIYRTAEDVSQWSEAMNGRGDVKQLDQQGFRDTLTSWDKNEGAALEMIGNVLGEKAHINHIEFNPSAGTEGNHNKN